MKLGFGHSADASDEDDDQVIMSTLSELILFLLFFMLILLGEKAVHRLGAPAESQEFVDHQCAKKLEICLTSETNRNQCYAGTLECLNDIAASDPVIIVSEAKGFEFPTGRSSLTEEAEKLFKEATIPQIVELLETPFYDPQAIEIIGHTDEGRYPDRYAPAPLELTSQQKTERIERAPDRAVIEVLDGKRPASELEPISNADLGLARALYIRELLLQDEQLPVIPILVYSASYTVEKYSDGGELTLASGRLTDGSSRRERDRRRIEIRIRGPMTTYKPK